MSTKGLPPAAAAVFALSIGCGDSWSRPTWCALAGGAVPKSCRFGVATVLTRVSSSNGSIVLVSYDEH